MIMKIHKLRLRKRKQLLCKELGNRIRKIRTNINANIKSGL